MGKRLEELYLDGVTVLEKPANPKYYPAYYLKPNSFLDEKLARKDHLELLNFISKLDESYDVMVDLHDNTKHPKEIESYKKDKLLMDPLPNLGRYSPHGRFAFYRTLQPPHEYADLTFHSQFSQKYLEKVFRTLEQKTKIPITATYYFEPEYGKWASKVEATIEFYPTRTIPSRPREFIDFPIENGVKLVSELIQQLRKFEPL